MSWEDSLEEGMATHSSILAGESLWTEGLAGYSPWSLKKLDTVEGLSIAQHIEKTIDESHQYT